MLKDASNDAIAELGLTEADVAFDPTLEKKPSLEEAILFYIDHPVEWVIDILGATPDTWQAAVMRDIASKRFVSVRSGHGVGKTTVEAWIGLWFLWTRPYSKTIVTSNTKEQLRDVLWAEFHKWIRLSGTLSAVFVWTEDRIYVRDHQEEWFIVARQPEVRRLGKSGILVAESIQGRHADQMLFILDEASGIDDAIMNSIDG
ncbi:MAG: hypothetical protein MN733_26430, partial [Nitrososphaera sp.]|nr:hypothetical protein [Nitrososphaera sp.]